jgi:hypothetical protein
VTPLSRGLLFGLLLVSPFWAAVVAAVWWLA